MTERFTLQYIDEPVISANLFDNETFIASVSIGGELLVEVLNQLVEENEQLQKEKNDAEVKLYSANEKILMQMDYDEIIKQNTENEIEITNIKKENKQLKKELEEIREERHKEFMIGNGR